MPLRRAGLALLVLHVLLPAASAPAEEAKTAEQIQACVEANLPEKSSVQSIALRSKDRLAAITESKAVLHWKKSEDGRSRVLIEFSQPEDLRGASVLLLERKQPGERDMFMYLPELRTVKRITSRMVTGSMFGTDFSYEDFEMIEDYAQKPKSTADRGRAARRRDRLGAGEPPGRRPDERLYAHPRVHRPRDLRAAQDRAVRGERPAAQGRQLRPQDAAPRCRGCTTRRSSRCGISSSRPRRSSRSRRSRWAWRSRTVSSARPTDEGQVAGTRPRSRDGQAARLLKAYAQFVTRHAVAVVLIAAALTALAITRIVDVRTLEPRLRLDPSIESLLPTRGREPRLLRQDPQDLRQRRHAAAGAASARRRLRALAAGRAAAHHDADRRDRRACSGW